MRHARLFDSGLLILLALAAWQGAYRYAGESAIASPIQTLIYAADFVAKPEFWRHAGATLKAFTYAAVIAIALGLSAGLLLGLQRAAGEIAEPVLASLYTIPKITLYPLILLVFGLGIPAKVAFGVIHGVIPIILFTLSAVKNLNPVLLRTARMMRLGRWQTISTVLAPAVLPELVTGVRTGFSLTFLGVLIGEMFASQQGLGFLIVNGISLHNVEMTTMVICAVIVFAIAANSLLLAFDRKLHHRG
jgi:NitT/TauT family transport system permease protein